MGIFFNKRSEMKNDGTELTKMLKIELRLTFNYMSSKLILLEKEQFFMENNKK